jgi:TPR repeat protein
MEDIYASGGNLAGDHMARVRLPVEILGIVALASGTIVAALFPSSPWIYGPLFVVVALTGVWLAIDKFLSHERYERAKRRKMLKENLEQLVDGEQLGRVRDISPFDIGVTRPISPPGNWAAGGSNHYFPRAKEDDDLDDHDLNDHDLDKALLSKRYVLIVGRSKVGKSRFAFEAVKRAPGNRRLICPAYGDSLARVLELDPPLELAGSVVWLDDLDRYLAGDGSTHGLTPTVLRKLSNTPDLTVVATMRTDEYEKYEVGTRFGKSFERVLDYFRPPMYLQPLKNLGDQSPRGADPDFISGIDSYGLGAMLVAGPRLVERLENAEDNPTNCVGRALVLAAVDWRRAGAAREIPERCLMRLFPGYLNGCAEPSDEALRRGLEWALAELYPRAGVALISTDGGDPPRHVVAFEYIVDSIEGGGKPVPAPAMETILDCANASDLFGVGLKSFVRAERSRFSRHTGSFLRIAEEAWSRAAGEGNVEAMLGLAFYFEDRAPAEAERWFRRAIAHGNVGAMVGLALHLEDRDPDQADELYREVEEDGDADDWVTLGVLLQSDDPSHAERLYRKAAGAGNVEAMLSLARLIGKRDPAQAEEWYRRVEEAGDADDWVALGVLLESRNLAEAERLYRRVADEGNAHVWLSAGLMCEYRDPAQAEAWYLRVEEDGDADASFALGRHLEDRNPARAEGLYRKAAGAGHVIAMCDLARLLEDRDPTEAAEWYQRVEEEGDAEVWLGLGSRFESRDPAQADRWYRRVAEVGDTRGPVFLAWLLEDRDPAQADEWYRRVEDDRDADAWFQVGVHVEERDPAQAERWYRRVAEIGDADAIVNLALLLEDRDPAQAEEWYREVEEDGDANAWVALGRLLEDRNRARAEGLYRKAAGAGHVGAMSDLARLLEERSLAEAEEWYRRAVRFGDAGAMVGLARLLEDRDR